MRDRIWTLGLRRPAAARCPYPFGRGTWASAITSVRSPSDSRERERERESRAACGKANQFSSAKMDKGQLAKSKIADTNLFPLSLSLSVFVSVSLSARGVSEDRKHRSDLLRVTRPLPAFAFYSFSFSSHLTFTSFLRIFIHCLPQSVLISDPIIVGGSRCGVSCIDYCLTAATCWEETIF